MSRMLQGIETLEQHQVLLEENPDAYKPKRCRHCGKAGLHHHGHYERNTPRGEGLALLLGALFILRFFARSAAVPARGYRHFCRQDVSIGGNPSKRFWNA